VRGTTRCWVTDRRSQADRPATGRGALIWLSSGAVILVAGGLGLAIHLLWLTACRMTKDEQGLPPGLGSCRGWLVGRSAARGRGSPCCPAWPGHIVLQAEQLLAQVAERAGE
jgi:hypothetical protein